MLATSREPLGIPGEVTFPVQPLDLPPEQAGPQKAVPASSQCAGVHVRSGFGIYAGLQLACRSVNDEIRFPWRSR